MPKYHVSDDVPAPEPQPAPEPEPQPTFLAFIPPRRAGEYVLPRDVKDARRGEE